MRDLPRGLPAAAAPSPVDRLVTTAALRPGPPGGAGARRATLLCAVGLALFALLPPGVLAAEPGSAVQRGEYVFHAAGCAACHTVPGSQDGGPGRLLAGGRRFDTPFGVFFSPNITPDRATGIGAWTEAQFVTALTEGEGPGGVHYYPVFPYPSYAAMRRADARDLHAYLMTLPPVEQANREHELPWYFRWRFANRIWKLLFLEEGEWQDDPQRSARWNRGAYIVNALAHCGECHTPRNALGALVDDRQLAGAEDGPDGEPVPNITPDPEAGIGGWTVVDIAEYLSSGMDPDTDFAGGAMAEVIEHGTSHLTLEDRRAVAEYVRSVPPRTGP